MSGTRDNVTDLRLALFGPTLDDSVLYGIDQLIGCFQPRATSDAQSSDEDSFYASCETLPVKEKLLLPHEPKLSFDEMNYIIDAIAHFRRRSRARHGDGSRARPRSTPLLRHSRWALARINEYDDGAKTYEVMKALDEIPIPPKPKSQDTEIVFAVLQNGNTLTYHKQRQQQQQQQQQQHIHPCGLRTRHHRCWAAFSLEAENWQLFFGPALYPRVECV
ncbi:uncharacterized protein LOC128723965 [Anopheles nili]|uniref:uncharacterized protein LOC128723965 n=1 Tax=Anopheles nili TaxID=185578 RepID=UPI00237B8C26|nr:uncharacterized protein LOC128723965 [Anopheles nili]